MTKREYKEEFNKKFNLGELDELLKPKKINEKDLEELIEDENKLRNRFKD